MSELINREDEGTETKIRINPVSRNDAAEEIQKRLLELQLKMAACSINHEYARIEFDEVDDIGVRQELLDYMHDCRNQYLEARVALAAYDPYALEEFEADLMRQKQAALPHYNA
jgi:xanthine dehydrogenase molybdopterin-binding subunit B